MRQAVWQYKCKRCGQVFDNGTITDGDGALLILTTLMADSTLHHVAVDRPGCSHVSRTFVHQGCELLTNVSTAYGIGDLVGYYLKEKEEA